MLFKNFFLILLSFDPDPTTRHTFWALVIGGMINWAGTYGASQASIQRFSSLPTLRDAKRYISQFILLLLHICQCYLNLSPYSYEAHLIY